MFVDDLGPAGETIPTWAREALSRMFWKQWYPMVKDRAVKVRFIIFSVSVKFSQTKPFLEMIFGPEPAA